MQPEPPDAISASISTWCELTEQQLHRLAIERLFYEFNRIGFTPDDLRCVIIHLKRENKRMTECRFTFRVHKIVGDLEWFASMLGEARAVERNTVHRTARDKVLNQWRGTPPETATASTAVPSREVVKQTLAKIAADL